MNTKKIIRTVFFALAVMAVFLSCASLGKATREPDEFTNEQEYYIGRAVAANILAVYKLQNNVPALTSYANQICNALIVNSERPEIYNGYHVGILDSDEINAFATPGGHIFITRGLVKCATSEDTLASIIAHEIGHILLQHGLKAISQSRDAAEGKKQVLGLTQYLASSAGYGNSAQVIDLFGDVVGDALNTMVSKGYSRDQEYDADGKALELLSLAGYQPSSLLDMLRALEKNQPGTKGGFNSTHPSPAQRIENVQKKLSGYSVPDTRSYREARYNAAK